MGPSPTIYWLEHEVTEETEEDEIEFHAGILLKIAYINDEVAAQCGKSHCLCLSTDVISLSFIDEQVDYGDNLANQATDPYSYLNSLAGDDIEQRQNFPRLTKDYVEYFLSVRIDEQIVDMPQITPGQGLYVSPQKTPEIICSDINAYGTDR